MERISGIGMVIVSLGFGRVIGINGCGISCDGVTGEMFLGDVGSGYGAAWEGVVVMGYRDR